VGGPPSPGVLAELTDPAVPGSPTALTDWRWLARAAQGRQVVVADPLGKQKLEAVEGGFRVLETAGPGLLEHLWTTRGDTVLSIEADGQPLWTGKLLAAAEPQPPNASALFTAPLVFSRAGMSHLLAPVGFRRSLRIVADTAEFPRYLSYRTFPEGTKVLPASPDPEGPYAQGLKSASELWNQGGYGFASKAAKPERELTREFVLPTKDRACVMESRGSDELTRLEFHVSPPLVGTLRQVVAEFLYDGVKEPSLRLPLPDLVGVPHPWTVGRWDGYNGDLAGGIQYPWYVHQPRFHYPEVTFCLNLPVPYKRGLRIELVNRSESVRFTGFARAILQSLSARQAQRAGRLCGARSLQPVIVGGEPKPLLHLPGPGRLVGLGLFMTGNESHYPPAVHSSMVSLTVDGGEPIRGRGLLPLWFQGIYGGPVIGMPIWNHPRYEHRYAGVMRHFLTDPIDFEREAVFAFAPGPDAAGAPTEATTVALWYRFSDEPYRAEGLADQAETLPHSFYGFGHGPKGSRLFRAMEAEDLAPMATASRCDIRAEEDAEHNYHPSGGRYLHVVADRPGSYVDCRVRLPSSRYFAVGTLALWGPNRGDFELDVLSREEAKLGPEFAQSGASYTGRAVGSVPMKAPVFMGHSLSLRRDASMEFPPPFLNPARDSEGILRFVCQSKRLDSGSFLMKLDQIRLDMPPPTEEGWYEFEDGPMPEVSGGMSARLPKHGRLEWSGWGAVNLTSLPGGSAVFRLFAPAGQARLVELVIRGTLGPTGGSWQAQVGEGKALALSPGKDDQEVVEWKIPVPEVALPGEIVLKLGRVALGKEEQGKPPSRPAELVLDAWSIRFPSAAPGP
jgi:hypothetical protein